MAGGRPSYDVVVLAGGSGRRLGGVDKLALEVAGRRLLDRVLDGCAAAARVVIAGPRRPVDRDVVWCREEPPGTGPLAAVAAAFPHTAADVVVLVAGDMPFVGGAIDALAAAVGEGDAAVLVAGAGVRQPLAAAYRRAALGVRLDALAPVTGAPVRRLLNGLTVTELPAAAAALDCDTPEDLLRAEVALGPDEPR